MNITFRKILKIGYRPVRIVKRLLKRVKYFYLPNIQNHYRNRMTNKTMPVFNQRTIITGKGKVEIGRHCMFGYRTGGFHRCGQIEIQPRTKNALIKIGNHVLTNNNLFFCAANLIVIGDYTLIGQYVTFMDFEAHGTKPNKRQDMGEIGKIIIGKNVWIGNNVTILKNTVIGDNTIVATGAVVKGNFPENVIIGGVPARIIKEL